MSHLVPEGSETSTNALDVDEFVSKIAVTFTQATPKDQAHVLATLLQKHAADCHGIIIPSDFVELAIQAMVHLKEAGRTNVIYNLVRAVGSKRPDSNEARLPVNRMPMGLIEHCASFFCASNARQVILFTRD